jgi:hypothetical protein
MRNIDLEGRDPITLPMKVATQGRKMYRAIKVFLFGAAATGTYNHMLNDEQVQVAQQNFMNMVAERAVEIQANATSEAVNPGKTWQDKQDQKAKDALNAAQAAVGAAIVDNISGKSPSGDPAPKREPKGTISKIVLGTGAATAAIKETIEYISNASKNDSNKGKDGDKPVQNNPPKNNNNDNNSPPVIDWKKILNPLDLSK